MGPTVRTTVNCPGATATSKGVQVSPPHRMDLKLLVRHSVTLGSPETGEHKCQHCGIRLLLPRIQERIKQVFCRKSGTEVPREAEMNTEEEQPT